MFILHSSNKTENLVAHLSHVVANMPLSSPFAREVFLIQSQGMERWLSQQLAAKFSVWGNYQFLFPGKFFSEMARKIDSRLSDTAFDRHLMMWRLEGLLRRVKGDEFAPVRQYLSGANHGLKRYQLAQQLSQLFDQYQMMRPDMLELWQRGQLLYGSDAERWQRSLWLQVLEQTGTRHRGLLWQAAIKKLLDAPEGQFSGVMPERINVFGLNTMPPLFLQYLHGLSRHGDVHLFLLNPSEDFWADLASRRQQILHENLHGHPLLATLGQQGREFQEMVLDQAIPFGLELDSFEPAEAVTLLQRLQNDILTNSLVCVPMSVDPSLRIHACHSRLREVEVLKNELLQALADDASLELRDIVVMAPDIQKYEPFIAAVFADIQHAIADRSLRLGNDALDAFINFLSLSQSRFGWQAVLDLLEQAVVYPGFGLSETDLDLIKHWVLDTNIRWGKSAQHKQELGLPEAGEYTWQMALERLLMGYAMGDDEAFIDGVLPYRDIEGSSAQALGGLCEFMNLLFRASQELKQAKTLANWSKRLYAYADLLLPAADAIERQQLNELLVELSADLDGVHTDTVELQVIISWLEGAVAERKSTHGFLRGQLTFCSMLPMRSIPFKVIALLGMNDGEFPKIDRPPTFDLLSQHYRKGDRSRRADDRYQFLEILLSVRQQLLITYIGQSITTNASIPPSVVINELLDVLQDSHQLTDVIIKHPLQPFSARYFGGESDLFSFSVADCATAVKLAERGQASGNLPAWWQGTIPSIGENIIEISELLQFFRHPQRYFLQQQLAVRLSGITADAEEREPFALGKAEAYTIYQEWIAARLQGGNLSVQKLQAQGRWLAGAVGELEFNRQQPLVDSFVAAIQNLNLGVAIDDKPMDIHIGVYRVIGKLGNLYQNGSLFYRYATLKGKDFVCAWLHHLLMNQRQVQTTYLLSNDMFVQFLPGDCQTEVLSGLLAIYCLGQQQPDAFFVEAALAYIDQAYQLNTNGRSKKTALEVAREQLERSIGQAYEPELRRLFGHADLNLVLGDVFEQQCQGLLQAVWNAVQHRL
ncbi:MAG: exodeoxyribonuclease V subunit gamma [Methylovulum sp.]|uniref:exodeoxyribonuclease V subunit gamma n=1 Tax=Methylovulum sp. TaxID=1916980 RepID=UPI00262BD4E1|nr:exodeoxyribonuclease V subunit gamma [Methylovulum sp.]MDD2723724.1 exodeoxyribonuclease V subunit gamma [Methylovulum sp.]MDD5123302.1 exodeoxyribonuclease V subunit gamma [Methylovulum sp.]